MKKHYVVVLAVILLASHASAQFQLPSLPVAPPVPIPVQIPGLEGILQAEPPITTGLEHATREQAAYDGFNPQVFTPLTEMPRTPEGGFYLLPGAYVFDAQSYCLKAGTYAPGVGGDGYLYAPLLGPKSDIVAHVLERSVSRPEIPQRDIQVLLWAIIARTKFSDMPLEMQRTAALLLTPEELFDLNGGALGLIPPDLMRQAFNQLPPVVRQVLEAEAQLRQLLSQASASYAELERVAVLAGAPPREHQVREVPSGRWSSHPDGYYIRYFPSGYTQTRIEIYVPEGTVLHPSSLSAGALLSGELLAQGGRTLPTFNPSRSPAVPGNSSAQRLGMSGRSSRNNDAAHRARQATDLLSNATSAGFPPSLGNWLGFSIPNALFNEILNFNFDTWGAATEALSGDPPRADYHLYEQPAQLSFTPLQAGDGVSPATAAAANALMEAGVELTALLQAALVTLDRLGGAQQAGDSYWSSEQAKLLVHYKREAGFAMQVVADKLEALAQTLQREGVADVMVTPDAVAAYQDGLRREGFSAQALEAAGALRLSTEDLEASRQRRLAVNPQQASGSLYGHMRQTALGLREVAALWTLLPEAAPPVADEAQPALASH